MESLNRNAIELVDEALEFPEQLGIGAHELDVGTTVLDFGVEFPGGLDAGTLLAEIQTAGLAGVTRSLAAVGDTPRTEIEVTTDQPGVACLCSQKAGMELAVDGFEGLGSGPARALIGEEDVFRQVGYHDAFDMAVLTVECAELPDEAVAERVAELADVEPSSLFLVAYPTASIAGSVSAAARTAELATYRLSELGYDPADVLTAHGAAPVPPVAATEATAMARAADAVAYGGRAHLQVAEPFDRVDEVASTASEDHGRPLVDVFDEVDWDHAEVDRSVHAPAEVAVDVVGGASHVAGDVDEATLAASFGV